MAGLHSNFKTLLRPVHTIRFLFLKTGNKRSDGPISRFRFCGENVGRSFSMCSQGPIFGTNKNRILKNESCERGFSHKKYSGCGSNFAETPAMIHFILLPKSATFVLFVLALGILCKTFGRCESSSWLRKKSDWFHCKKISQKLKYWNFKLCEKSERCRCWDSNSQPAAKDICRPILLVSPTCACPLATGERCE